RATISLCASNEAATLTRVGGSTRIPNRSIRRLRSGSSQRNTTARRRAASDDASLENSNEESAGGGADQVARASAAGTAANERAWKIVAFSVSGSNGFVTREVGSGLSPVNRTPG